MKRTPASPCPRRRAGRRGEVEQVEQRRFDVRQGVGKESRPRRPLHAQAPWRTIRTPAQILESVTEKPGRSGVVSESPLSTLSSTARVNVCSSRRR